MKKRNLRHVSVLAIILCCVSLISIGFATWVITIPSSDGQEGNIKVEEVEALDKICNVLDCQPADLMEFISEPTVQEKAD